MPDERMDTLLLEIAERARNATSLPPFETARRRGLLRRRNQRIVIGVAAAVVAATLVAGVSSLTDNDASAPTPTVPDRSALPDPGKPTLADHGDTPIDQLSPDEIVHDTRANLQMSIPLTSVGTPGVAATWRLCSGKHCRLVLAVSSDDFATAGYLDVSQNRSPLYADAGGGAVMLADASNRQPVQIVRSDGSVQENNADQQISPLQDGEATVNALRYIDNLQTFFGRVGPVAVDPRTATTHPIPTPEDITAIGGLQPNGLLEAFGFDPGGGSTVALWSTDGGSTWDRHVAAPRDIPVWVIATTTPDTLAFGVHSDDSNNSLDWSPMLRSLDGGDSWEEAPVGRADDASQVPQAAGYAAALVLPDNSLLMSVESWSDGAEPGIYRSAGKDWSTLQRVDVDLPSSAVTTSMNSPWGFDLQAPQVDPDTGAVTLYAVDLHQQLFASIDQGQTWTFVRTR